MLIRWGTPWELHKAMGYLDCGYKYFTAGPPMVERELPKLLESCFIQGRLKAFRELHRELLHPFQCLCGIGWAGMLEQYIPDVTV